MLPLLLRAMAVAAVLLKAEEKLKSREPMQWFSRHLTSPPFMGLVHHLLAAMDKADIRIHSPTES